MKTLGLIVNIFLPGIGTLFVKKFGQAILQIILGIIGSILTFSTIGSVIGLPLLIVVWIWAIISVVNTPAEPVQVVVKEN